MQRIKINTLLAAFLVAFSEWAAAQSGMASLRVRCDGDNVGAGVSINGQFKGECPFDAMVPEGTLKIEARKPMGKEHERLFEQEMRIGAGIIKSIEVVLSKEQLTAEGKRARAAQAEAERREQEARQAEQQRQAAEAERLRAAKFERLRDAAEGGDVEAMSALAEILQIGQHGQPANPAQAHAWNQKAADAGNVDAMFRLSQRVEMNSESTAQDWLRKAAQAGHLGAQERLDRLPRYCQAEGLGAGFFAGTFVKSPGFEDIQADGTDKPVKAALERYAQQLTRLQPGTWDKALDKPTLGCSSMRNEHFGNALVCNMIPAKGVPYIRVICGSTAKHRDHLQWLETEARKDGGSVAGGTMLFDWLGK